MTKEKATMTTTITCGKNHSGNNALVRSGKGYECCGCGQHYVGFVVVSRRGMTPWATVHTMSAAAKASKAAKSHGMSGEIVAY